MIDMSVPQYFIYPDGILSKFLLHFFCGIVDQRAAPKMALMVWHAPRLMDLTVMTNFSITAVTRVT